MSREGRFDDASREELSALVQRLQQSLIERGQECYRIRARIRDLEADLGRAELLLHGYQASQWGVAHDDNIQRVRDFLAELKERYHAEREESVHES